MTENSDRELRGRKAEQEDLSLEDFSEKVLKRKRKRKRKGRAEHPVPEKEGEC